MNSNVAYFYNMEHKNDDCEEDVSAEDDEEDDLQNARSREKILHLRIKIDRTLVGKTHTYNPRYR